MYDGVVVGAYLGPKKFDIIYLPLRIIIINLYFLFLLAYILFDTIHYYINELN